MRIAVTGATGFIGRYIVRHLIDLGNTLRCWHRPESDRGGFEQVASSLEWVFRELNDGREAELVRDCDAVVHAALDHPGGGFRSAGGELIPFVERNVIGTLRLMEAARHAKVQRFVFLSTCAVHERILDDRPLDETHPLIPTSHYGAHKAALEKFVHSYGLGNGLSICALRPCGVYGMAYPVTSSKWFDLVRATVAGRPIECRRGGKEVHAADVAKAVAILLTAGNVSGEAFNCCDRYISDWDVAVIAKELTQSESQVLGHSTQPRHQIESGKLKGLGMQFGGEPLLRETIGELVKAAELLT